MKFFPGIWVVTLGLGALACRDPGSAPSNEGRDLPLFLLGGNGIEGTGCDFGAAWTTSASNHFDSIALTFLDVSHHVRSACGDLFFQSDSGFVHARWTPSHGGSAGINTWQAKYRQTSSAFQDSLVILFQGPVAEHTQKDTILPMVFGQGYDAIGLRLRIVNPPASTPADFDLECDEACAQHWRHIDAPHLDSLRIVNGSSVLVFWTSHNRQRSFDSTEIYRDGALVGATGGTANSFTDGPLSSANHAYQVRHTSTRSPNSPELAAHPNSLFSAEFTISAGGPPPPTALACAGNFAPTMDCNWTDADQTAGTNVYRGDTLKVTVGAGVAAWTDPAVTRGNTYTYKVQHVKNGLVGAYSGTVIVAANPVAPSGLTCAAITSRVITCTWVNGEPSDSTLLQRQPGSGTTRLAALVNPRAASYYDADTILHAQTTWTYRAYHRRGADSTTLATAPAVTTPVPASPGTLDCIGHFDPMITCNWGNAEPGDSTKLYRNNGLLVTVAAGQTGYSDWSVSAGVTYTYKARYKDLGVLGDSAIDATTTAAVEAPRGFACSGDANGTSALCIWVTLEPADSMELWRALGSAFKNAVVTIVAPGVTGHTDNNLQNGTTYYYKVRHRRSATVVGPWSPTVTAVPGSPTPLRPGG